ncbi:DUF5801 repeats-in-toxin domain-containing protein (plasmid) [Sinorhizobium chiapasense]|uniref:DUF5801 repeats-in-toxin domain-containing protein n=1 Tax=Sinorhizobium chiapasense TaxID=501572 RepID=UPI002FE34FA6
MATEGTAISNEAAAAQADAIEFRNAPDGKGDRLVAQAATRAEEEPQLVDPATGAPVKGAETAPQTPPMPATVTADASNVVHLPAGASIEKIKVVGSDIVLEQPDGSTITIHNAALKVPTFVIGDAEIPRETLVAVLGENGINVAAGPDGSISVVSNQSSGGGFSDANGDIGQAGPVIDLLPPTSLQFPALEATELLPFTLDANENPSIIPDGGSSDPSGIFVSDREVDEAGLASGSRAGDGSASVNGVFTISDPDGLDDVASLTINGQTFPIGSLAGQSVTGLFGVLTITAYDPVTGVAQYTYELTSPVTGSGPGTNVEQDRDTFNLTVTDADGATGTAALRIDVVDDVPMIGITDPESAQVVEGQTLAGNWMLAAGADGVGTVNVTVGNTTQTLTLAAGQKVVFALAEGTLTVNADKSWSFAAANNLNNAGSVNVSFSLSAADADGDTTSDSQTITITDGAGPTVDPLAASAALTLDDQNLADGSTPAGSDTSSGTIGFTAGSDAIATIAFSNDVSGLSGALTWDRVSDTQIVGRAGGVAIVTLDLVRSGDSATVTATLNDNYASHPGIDADDLADLGSVKVIASDTDGDKAEGTVSVSVSDDMPVIDTTQIAAPAALTVDETALGTNASFEVSDVFKAGFSAYGADGAGSVSYGLQLSGSAVGSGLFAHGENGTKGAEILLSQTGNVITGAVNGTTYFTITLANGQVTLDQIKAIWHDNTGSNDEPLSLKLANNALQLVATVTDADGDAKSQGVDLGTGSTFTFKDDGPTIDTTQIAAPAALTVDETALGTNASFEVSDVFKAGFSAYGADGAGSVSYGLQLSSSAVGSGLFAHGENGTKGAEILLSQTDNVITGAVNGTTYFTITLANGQVTLDQIKAIWHGDSPSNYNETTSLTITSGSLQLVATVTDGDKDVATAKVDLGGGLISFEDDGPSAALGLVSQPKTLVVDETVGENAGEAAVGLGQVTVAGSDLFTTAGTSVGQDNEGATTAYSLAIVNGGHTGLYLTGGTTEILLVQNGSVIEGRVGSTVAFTVAINAADGSVTLTQYESLNHTNTGSYDEAVSLAANALQAVLTVTDGDKDVATAKVDLGGGLISFEDDGPSAALGLVSQPKTLVVDETVGENAGEAAVGLGQVTVAGSDLFTTAGTSVGQDNEGATTAYSLAIVNGGHTGLYLTGGTTEILLVQNGSVIEGRVGSTVAFTVAINAADGSVTLTQYESLNHTNTGSYDEAVSLAANALQAVLTVTDGDKDVATAKVDLGGGLISFEDDGPSAALGLVSQPKTLVVDETVGENAGEAAVGLGQVTVAGSDLFTTAGTSVGQDNEGATTAYSLAIVNGGHTGLYLTGGTTEILLVQNGSVIEGRVGSTVAFTVAINAADGSVTLTQYESLNHTNTGSYDEAVSLAANALQAVLTVTDGDKDVATAKVDLGGGLISFEDDGPSAALGLVSQPKTLVVDETVGENAGEAAVGLGQVTVAGSDLFTTAGTSVGQDNEGATTAYSLAIVNGGHTGLYLTGGTTEILLVQNGSVIEGRVGSTVAFTVAINAADGSVTLTQYESLNHTNTGSYDEAVSLAANALQAVLTVTDGDKDVATAKVDLGGGLISFEDDGPSAALGLVSQPKTLVVDETVGENAGEAAVGLGQVTVAGSDLFTTAGTSVGQDNEGATTAYSLAIVNGGHTGLYLTGGTTEILLVQNGSVIEGRVGSTVAFTVAINAADGSVTLTQYESLNHTNTGSYDEAVSLAANALQAVLTVTDGDKDVATAKVDLGGGLISFEDDGPSAALGLVSQPKTLVVDETVGENAGEAAVGLGQVTVAGSDLFTTAGTSVGQDNEGATTAYSLAIVNGGHTGLYLTGGTTEILLVQNGSVIEGRVGSTVAFTVAINAADGSVTLTQYESLNHTNTGSYDEAVSLAANALQAVLTVTDGDKDVATAKVDLGGGLISFEDDGPSAALGLVSQPKTLVVDETVGENAGEAAVGLGQVTVAGSDLFTTAGTSVGQDNEGATTAYSLAIVNGGHTGLYLTGGTTEILLVQNGSVIEGRVGSTVAFTVAINAADGSVTLTQYESLNHTNTGSYDEAVSLAANALQAVLTVTDGDKDVATAKVDLGGGLISFEDDGPSAALGLVSQPKTLVVDETVGENAGEAAVGLGQVTVAGSDLFTTAGTSVGQDNEGATTAYSLAIVNGGHTGLYLTGGTTEILLVQNGSVIEGRVGSTVAFTVAINAADGSVTLTQYESLNHTNTGSYDEAVSLAANALQAVLTVTDGDKDVATAKVDLGGGLISFEDDGPSAALGLVSQPKTLVVDETVGENAGEAAVGLGQVTVAGSDLFTTAGTSAGQDNEGATTAYSLAIVNGGHTGLYLTGGTTEILLVQNGSVIEGRVGSTVAFTVAINAADGSVTLTQYESLNHTNTGSYDEAVSLAANALQAVLTVTDGDKDVATAKVDLGGGLISFEDDGPSAALGLVSQPKTLVVDETVGENAGEAAVGLGQVTVAGSDLFTTAGTSAGQDNEGATTAYSLAIVNGGHTGLYLTGGTTEILLVQNGSVIEGRVGSTVAFTVAINAADGSVTLTQYESLNHTNTGSYDEAVSLAANALQAVLTVTDGDKDVATAKVDLGGGLISFEDDGPSAALGLVSQPKTLVVDETVGENAGEAAVGLGQVTVAGSDLFTTAGTSVGQDNEGATTAYSLAIVNGGHTGLYLTGGTTEILLVQNGSVIEGRVGSTVAFTVAINAADGSVTLTQYESLNHTNTGSYDEAVSLAANALQAVLTVTDGDKDVATAKVDLGGGLISFEDDGPSAALGLVSQPKTLVVDETVGENAGEAAVGLGQVTVAGSDLFTTAGTSVGQDNEGATTAYSLAIVNGGHTGLYLTGGTTEILLVQNGSVIEGRVGSTVAFTVAINAADGSVTLTQYESLNHTNTGSYDEAVSLAANALQAVLTVTDGDKDVATAKVDLGGGLISFEDDGPSAALGLVSQPKTLVVDETVGENAGEAAVGLGQVTVAGSDLFTTAGTSVGQDNEGATTAYSLAIVNGGHTGLYLTGGTTEILLVQNGSVIEGRVGSTVAFTVAINAADGSVTLTQYESLNHTNTGSYDEAVSLAANALQAVLTVTDGDKDVATAKVDLGGGLISFEDDGIAVGTVTNAILANEVGKLQGLLAFNAGADGLASEAISSISGLPQGWTTSAGGSSSINVFAPGSATPTFTIKLNLDGTYEVTQFAVRPGTTSTIDLAYNIKNSPTGNYDFGFVKLTALADDTGGNDDANFNAYAFGTSNAFGLGNPTFNANDSFKMEFDSPVSNFKLNIAQVDEDGVINVTLSNGGLNAVTIPVQVNAGDTFVEISPSVFLAHQKTPFNFDTVILTGVDEAGNKDIKVSFTTLSYKESVPATDVNFTVNAVGVDGDGDKVSTSFVVTSAGGSSANNTFTGTSANEVFHGGSGTDTINGADGSDIADYTGSTSAVFINLDDSGNASSSASTGSQPEGSIGGGDAAGDTLTGIEGLIGGSGNDFLHGNSGANYLAGGIGSDTLYGEGGADSLYGGLGNDTLYGGTGSDTMTGGAGSDTFVIDPNDLSLGIADVITDYESGDFVDLSELLGNLPADTDLKGDYVQVVQDGQNANLQVDTNGNGDSWHTVAVLEHFQATEAVKVLFNNTSGTKTEQDIH